MRMYILNDNKEPVLETSHHIWSVFMEQADKRIVKLHIVPIKKNLVFKISTVFTGTDLGFNLFGNSKPEVFETMVFQALQTGKFKIADGDYQRRYCTWDEAAEGHMEILEQVLADNDQLPSWPDEIPEDVFK